jgi:tetratricopeptide (TPR) repeat protein
MARSSLAGFYFNAPGIAGGSDAKGMEQVEEIKKHDAKSAHMLLAGFHAEREEIDKARAEYRAVIALDPGNADAYYLLGLQCQVAKDWNTAFEAFEAGVRATDDLRSLYQIGRTGVFSGEKLERARAALQDYIAREPDPKQLPSVAHAHWRLGMLYAKLGRNGLARREYQTALKLDPKLEQAREALEDLG